MFVDFTNHNAVCASTLGQELTLKQWLFLYLYELQAEYYLFTYFSVMLGSIYPLSTYLSVFQSIYLDRQIECLLYKQEKKVKLCSQKTLFYTKKALKISVNSVKLQHIKSTYKVNFSIYEQLSIWKIIWKQFHPQFSFQGKNKHINKNPRNKFSLDVEI